ncbi:sigma-70 family RNA polymerase sigma factor [Mucilaginibacter sp.]|uniref:sigma-70 family RNA polymerase sigma factor n=1 Tax=Mucilaginibacter sp. TaxID=1882438 RepID=UPI0025F48A58|nr:sigma-70 family RNA polymerase sigma factor [Mucilaginibacter sp.]
MQNLETISTPISNRCSLEPQYWVERHADFMYNYALIRINDSDLAQDLVQETFLAALERTSTFEGRSSERTWLVSILKNKIFDVYRKRSSGLTIRMPAKTPSEVEDFFNPDDGRWNKTDQPVYMSFEENDPLREKEFNQVLEKCMLKLPELWLAVFRMKHIDDQSTQIICNELRVTPSNYWVIIHRAKLNLRACLQKNWN